MSASKLSPRFLTASERGVVVEFGDRIDPELFRQVGQLTEALDACPCPGVLELIPTYRSLLVHFDPLQVERNQVEAWIRMHLQTGGATTSSSRVVVIPTLYGGEYGPDLGDVAAHAHMTSEEVIGIHCSRDYLVYMIGFTPGFPYLGGLDPQIACPRLSSPRTLVPVGSVGIAETQTGIYPLATPGGWRLIGRTPVKLFDPASQAPFLLQAGDYLRFSAIGMDEYQHITQEVATRTYTPAILMKEGGQ